MTPKRSWPGLVISIFFHGAVLSIPLANSINGEPPPVELQLPAMTLEEAPRLEAPALAPAHGTPQPPPPPRQSAVEDDPAQEAPPAPEKATSLVMPVREVPKPPKVEKPVAKRERIKPSKKKMAPRAGTEAIPEAEPSKAMETDSATTSTSSTPEDGQKDTGAMASTHGTPHGEREATGPIDSSFGSGEGPRFVSRASPKYPRYARELGKEGTVVLRLVIDERGCLTHVEVIEKAGAGFDEEALKAVKSSTFSPAKKNGKPVPCRASLPIRFVLRSESDD